MERTEPLPTDGASPSPPTGLAACTAIASACAPYDLGTGAIADCHRLAREEDPDPCEAEYARCIAACAPGAYTRIDVRVRFAAAVEEEAYRCDRTFAGLGPDDQAISPRELRVYVHGVRLLDRNGDSVGIALAQDAPFQTQDVALLDFGGSERGCDEGGQAGNTEIVGSVPFGEYVGLAFRIGVPDELNHRAIDLSDSPLDDPTLTGGSIQGRVFVSMAAELTQGDTTFAYELRVGSTNCGIDQTSGLVTCAKPNRANAAFPAFHPRDDEIVFDVGALIARSRPTASAATCSVDTGIGSCIDAFAALGIHHATGAPLASPSIVKVRRAISSDAN